MSNFCCFSTKQQINELVLLIVNKIKMIECGIFDHSGSRVGDTNGIQTSIKRVPLAELQPNTPSPSFVKSKVCENISILCSGGLTVDQKELVDYSSSARATGAPLENDCTLDSYRTPMKRQECFDLIDSVSMTSTLDDDFDESILEEIDALFEQKSAARAEGQVLSCDIDPGGHHDGNSNGDLSASLESVTGYESVKMEGALDSGSDLDPITKGSETSQTIEIGNMPEEYSKYLQSLNDRQREAACNDISVPLMIVAGPGSGKVPLYLSLLFSYTYIKKMIFLISILIYPILYSYIL